MAEQGTQQQQQQQQQLQRNRDILPYKNRLQEFTQRAKIQIPMYQITNEGENHAPRFRASVVVDGNTYTSPNTFSSHKAAEQDVAKTALEAISTKINNWTSNNTNEGFPSIYELQEKGFCKLILHEFAAKMNVAGPKYETTSFEGVLPGFISSVVFGSVKHTSESCKSKKEAEQNAARQVIVSILGNLGLGTILPEIIKAKAKYFSSGKRQNCSDVVIGVSPLGMDIGTDIGSSAIREEVTMDGNANKAIILTQNASLEAIEGDRDANKAGSLVENVPPMALNEQISDIGASAIREEVTMDGNANKAIILIQNASLEAIEGDRDANKAASRVENVPPMALNEQISDVKPYEIQPNLHLLNSNPKRKSKNQRRKANKKMKAEVQVVNEVVAAS